MNSKQTNNFFIHSSLSGVSTAFLQEQPDKKAGYYQHLIYRLLTRHLNSLESVEQLARQIAAIARHAYLTRQMEAVEQASQLLLAFPISNEMKKVALYYDALCTKRKGDVEGALRSLEQVAQGAIPQYRARALQNIGLTYHASGQVDEALPFYMAAQVAASGCDPMTLAESQCMIAVVRSVHGDHRQSLVDLENVFPLVRAVGKFYPAFYYDYLNSLAVELGEASRIAEAQSAINISVGSPYSSVYSYWFETREEIEQKRNYRDLSRCFLDRSISEISEPEAVTDSTANLSVEVSAEHATEIKPSRTLTLWPVGQSIYLKPVTLPIADKAIIPGGLAQSFLLQCLGRCVQPRAPPAVWFQIKLHH